MPSPLPEKIKKRKYVFFHDAIRAIREGKMVTKAEWGNDDIHGLLREGQLMIRLEDGTYYQWIISEGDMVGNDWIIL